MGTKHISQKLQNLLSIHEAKSSMEEKANL